MNNIEMLSEKRTILTICYFVAIISLCTLHIDIIAEIRDIYTILEGEYS